VEHTDEYKEIDRIARLIEEEESKIAVVNAEKVNRLMEAYLILKELTRGTGLSVSYKIHEPFKSGGSVSVVGGSMEFKDIKRFMTAVRLASNFEAYPKTDGTVCMTLSFNGLTTPIDKL